MAKATPMIVCSIAQQADGGNGCQDHPQNHKGERQGERIHKNVQIVQWQREWTEEGKSRLNILNMFVLKSHRKIYKLALALHSELYGNS